MNERTLFLEALDRPSPAGRAAYLDAACAGDRALRERVEALLSSHAGAGEFLRGSAPERLAGGPVTDPQGDDTRTGPAAPADDDRLDFLTPSDQPGSIGRLGHYEVQSVVGRGGMGVVLKAFDSNLHRVAAIKVMAPPLAAGAAARQRFTREARAAAAVAHDHVVTIHGVEEANGLPYIVMQYVAGQSLQDRLDRNGPLPVPEALRIGMQAASGLAAAHAQGLVHRDVKPANILLENGVERVKLTDFGLARAADDASLTRSGQVAGTPQYMSPEQAEGRPVDARSDLFSLGSVLYAMLAGRPPFRAPTAMAVLKRVCEEAPTPVRELNPEVPGWLADLIAKLHAKDPADRYQTAAEVADLLGCHLAHLQHPSVVPLPAAARPPAHRPRGRRWAVAAAVAVAVLAAVGGTEATGVTNVRGTVIRILTPEGTLVVEADDPDVKVTVEGDGGLIITGAGPQEVRVRPGSYRLRAEKDGKPVQPDRDLVVISRGDRQVVRVRVEGRTAVAAAPAAEPGAFVLLAAGAERRFDTLKDAVLTSADGDTIEVRGHGPFPMDSTEVKHALTVRAGAGFRPVFAAESASDRLGGLLDAYGPLRLEGLEFRCSPAVWRLVFARGPIHAANCRFDRSGEGICVGCEAVGRLRNCELWAPQGGALEVLGNHKADVEVTNCVLFGHTNLQDTSDAEGISVRLSGCTLAPPRTSAIFHCLGRGMTPVTAPPGPTGPRVRVSTIDCVFASQFSLFSVVQRRGPEPRIEVADLEAWLPRRVRWTEARNVYRQPLPYLGVQLSDSWHNVSTRGKDLADWTRFWGQTDTGSSEGVVRFVGGDLSARALAGASEFTPADFRLRSDSAGYKAGKGGKDLGADIDLVGPGPAYERWKKTPEYRAWLKETGQSTK